MFLDPIETVKREWFVISGAPWSVAVIVALAIVITWRVLKSIHKQEIDSFNARFQLAEERVRNLERVTRDQRPTKTAFADLENIVLLERTMELVSRLREYGLDDQKRERDIEIFDSQRSLSWGSVDDYTRKAQEKQNERAQARDAYFQANFKIDAVLLRNEILRRLPHLPDGGIWGPGREYRIDPSSYEKIQYDFQFGELANNLEGLAKQLPITPANPPASTRNP